MSRYPINGKGLRGVATMNHEERMHKEAENIARLLDDGKPFAVQQAAEMLRQDLQDLQGRPWEQRHLLDMVNKMEKKGKGADIKLDLSGQTWEFSNDIYNHTPVGVVIKPIGSRVKY